MLRHLLPLLLLPGLIAPAGVPGKGGTASFASQVDAILAPRYDANEPGAAVLVARDGKVIFRKGYGLASVELGVPVQAGHVFRIGSITKQFTAASILLLVEDGKVDLQAPVSHYLAGTPDSWAGVTVAMLLNHTSGIPNFSNQKGYVENLGRSMTQEAMFKSFIGFQPMDFDPGAQHKYSNTGYFLLGMVIEKVSGRPWDVFMKERLLEPLGLSHTRRETQEDLIPGLVQGYTHGPRPAAFRSMSQSGAAGALVSNVDDLATWTFALHGGKVLKPESLRLMFADTVLRSGQQVPYGFGMAFRVSQGHRLIGHGGFTSGFLSLVEMDPVTQSVAILLNNTDGLRLRDQEAFAGDNYYARRLLALAGARPIVEPEVTLAPGQVAPLAGLYDCPGANRHITCEGRRLFSQKSGARKRVLVALSPTAFRVKDSDTVLHFIMEGNRVTGLRLQLGDDLEGPLQERIDEATAFKTSPLDVTAFDACAGEYELEPGFTIRYWREGQRLFTQGTGQEREEMFPRDSYTYFMKTVQVRIVFKRNPEGKVDAAVLFQNGQEEGMHRIR